MSENKEVTVEVDIEGDPVEGQIAVRAETKGVSGVSEVVIIDPAPMEIVPLGEAASLRSAIMELARDKDFDVEKLRALDELQERVENRQARRSFNEAFVRLQGRLPTIKRDGRLEYPKDKSKPDGDKQLIAKYSKWEDILEAIQPILAEEGFALTFGMEMRADGGGLMVWGILIYGGYEHKGPAIPIPLDTSGGKNNVQSYGSTTSYGQRYATKALLNLRFEGEDDDGFAAGAASVTPDQAAKLIELVDRARIATSKDHVARRAEVKAWFTDVLSYEITSYTAIRQEDYPRLARMLKSLADKAAAAAKEEMKV